MTIKEIFEKLKKARNIIFELYYKEKLYAGWLYQEQIDIMDSIFYNTILGLTWNWKYAKNIIINISRQWWKSFTVFNCLVIMILFLPKLLNIPNFTVWLTVNKKDQVKKNYQEVKKYLNMIAPDFWIEFSENNKWALELSNWAKIVIFSMESEHNQWETLHLSIVDESQDIDFDKYDKEILPMLSRTGWITVKLWVWWYKINQYYKDILDTVKNIVFKFDYSKIIDIDSKMFTKTKDFRYNIYKQSLDKTDKNTTSFQTEYLLKWLITIWNFIKIQDLREMCVNYKLYDYYKLPCWVWIDWAKSIDKTIVTVVSRIDWKIRILNWKVFEWTKYNEQIKEIVPFLNNYNVQKIFTDNTWVWSWVLDFLEEKINSNKIERVNFNEKTKDEMYTTLNNIFLDNLLEYPSWTQYTETFETETSELEKEFTRLWKMKCHHPDLAWKHDDFPDSLALACLFTLEKEWDIYQVN